MGWGCVRNSVLSEVQDFVRPLYKRQGAEASAIVYSLVETTKANGIESDVYLMLVLSMLPYLGKSPAQEETGKANALESGSETPGICTEMNERQGSANGTLPRYNLNMRLLSAYCLSISLLNPQIE